jgi:hypothetical protein
MPEPTPVRSVGSGNKSREDAVGRERRASEPFPVQLFDADSMIRRAGAMPAVTPRAVAGFEPSMRPSHTLREH